jgi:hypothetical protein
MTGADFAFMADSDRNPQFRRRWLDDPPLKRRKRPAAAKQGRFRNTPHHVSAAENTDLARDVNRRGAR